MRPAKTIPANKKKRIAVIAMESIHAVKAPSNHAILPALCRGGQCQWKPPLP